MASPQKKFSDKLNDLVAIINPLAYMAFKDNPIIIMMMPIFVFIIRQIEEWYGNDVKAYKDLFPNMASITINGVSPYGYSYESQCYAHVSWYILKEVKLDKIEATTHVSGITNYELDEDVIGSLKYKGNTIIIRFTNQKGVGKKLYLYSKDNNLDLLKEFVDFCIKEYKSNRTIRVSPGNQLYTYSPPSCAWMQSPINVIKTKDNTFLTDEQSQIFDRVTKFKEAAEKYKTYGIPYKIGFLLHGLPGTGKTSVGYALAHTFNMNIYKLDYKCLGSDDRLISAVNSIPANSLVIIEDIDTYKFAQKRTNTKKTDTNKLIESTENLTNAISGIISQTDKNAPDSDSLISISNNIQMESILHILDGYTSLHGCIIIFTTNYVDHIDSALLRPGRIDHTYEFTYATIEQIKNILDFFGKQKNEHKYIINDKPIQITTSRLIQDLLVDFK